MELDDMIALQIAKANLNEKLAQICSPENPELDESSMRCAAEHRQLADWLRELKGLRLMLDWMIQCGFGYDNIPEEYERYKNDVESMKYGEGLIYIATCEANSEGES